MRYKLRYYFEDEILKWFEISPWEKKKRQSMIFWFPFYVCLALQNCVKNI